MGKRNLETATLEIEHPESFTQSLISSLRKSVSVDTGKTDFELENINGADDVAALHARYALGLDCGNYLRSDVMPLYSTQTGRRLSTTILLPSMERASRSGVLASYQKELDIQSKNAGTELNEIAHGVEWLLSMREIADFVDLYLRENGESENGKSEKETMFKSTSIAESTLKTKDGRERACLLMKALLTALGTPLDYALKQRKITVEDQTRTHKEALLRMEGAINLSADAKKTYYELSQPPPSLPEPSPPPPEPPAPPEPSASPSEMPDDGAEPPPLEPFPFGTGAGRTTIPSVFISPTYDKPGIISPPPVQEDVSAPVAAQVFTLLTLLGGGSYTPSFTQGPTLPPSTAPDSGGPLREIIMAPLQELLPDVPPNLQEGENSGLVDLIKEGNLSTKQVYDDVTGEYDERGVLVRLKIPLLAYLDKLLPDLEDRIKALVPAGETLPKDDKELDKLDKLRTLKEIVDALIEAGMDTVRLNAARFYRVLCGNKDCDLYETIERNPDKQKELVGGYNLNQRDVHNLFYYLQNKYKEDNEERKGVKKRASNPKDPLDGAKENNTWSDLAEAMPYIIAWARPPRMQQRYGTQSTIGTEGTSAFSANDEIRIDVTDFTQKARTLASGEIKESKMPPIGCEGDMIGVGANSITPDALCAAMRSLTQISDYEIPPPIKGMDLEHIGILSPVWKVTKPEEWGTFLWKNETYEADNIQNQLRTARQRGTQYRDNLQGGWDAWSDVHYCIGRGLVGLPGAHKTSGKVTTSLAGTVAFNTFNEPPQTLVYSFPASEWRGPSTAYSASTLPKAEIKSFAFEETNTYSDFVLLPAKQENGEHRSRTKQDLKPNKIDYDVPRHAQWMPIKRVNDNNVDIVDIDYSDKALALCKATIDEHLIDHFARLAYDKDTSKPARYFMIAARAATKLHQLESLVSVSKEKYEDYTGAGELYLWEKSLSWYETRPVVRCTDGKVLWPCDAGVHELRGLLKDDTSLTLVKSQNELIGKFKDGWRYADWRPRTDDLEGDKVLGASTDNGVSSISIVDATAQMRQLLRKENTTVPIYVAHRIGALPIDSYSVSETSLPLIKVAPKVLSISSLKGMLQKGLELCKQMHCLQTERDIVDKELQKLSKNPEGGADDDEETNIAVKRQAVVLDDALREASIGGDRLWAFCKHFAGVTSEPVESIMVIDESMMVQQQRQLRDRRRKAADQAAAVHYQIVSSFFKAVLADSKLKLGVDTPSGASTPSLTISSESVRREAAELSRRMGESGGFFNNGVSLNRLLENGTGDLSMEELFVQLRQLGLDLQQTAMQHLQPETSSVGESLAFLGAPRNALFIRWKPEAKAAIRQAYDTFQREFLVSGQMMRHITAYELIEGVSEELCVAFANLCAHMMALAKLNNPQTVMYTSRTATITTAKMIQISLRKLVTIAHEYTMRTGAPMASGNPKDDRQHYFQGMYPLLRPVPRHQPPIDRSGYHSYPPNRYGSG